MRGEYCVAGASILSIFSIILLVFAHIGQLKPNSVPAGLYMVKVDMSAYGNALLTATKTAVPGLYNTSPTDLLGLSLGLHQDYRWGLYSACGYQKSGASGVCNSTSFGYPWQPLGQVIADTPAKFKVQTGDIIPDSSFKDDGYNAGLSRAAFWMIFLGSVAIALAFIVGVIPHKFSFFVATLMSGLASLLLMIGAAIWTSIIKKAEFLNIVKVQNGAALGVVVSTGPGVYLIWVAFAFALLSTVPYGISACTFRR